jgi:ABC-2 type transport system permease protein
MAGAIFRKTLRDARRGILGWGIALAALAFLVVIIYPSVSEFQEMNDYVEALPDVFKAMLGDLEDITSPAGFLSVELFFYTPLVLAVYAVMAGAAAVAGEERRGTIDLLMSTPVPRWRALLEKFAAFAVALVGVLSVTYLGIVVGLILTPSMEISLGRLLEAVFNLLPITLAIGALAFLFSAALPGRLSAGLMATVVIVAAYVLNLLSEMSDALRPVRGLSPFYYYGTRTIFDGLNWGNVTVLLIASAVLLALAVFSFERRDLAV